MSETKFTPGPWIVADDGDDEPLLSINIELPEGRYVDIDGVRVFTPSRHPIARLTKKMRGGGNTPWGPGEFEANARIMAAAPALYGIVERLAAKIAFYRESDGSHYAAHNTFVDYDFFNEALLALAQTQERTQAVNDAAQARSLEDE